MMRTLRMMASMAALYAVILAILPPSTTSHPMGLKKSNHILIVQEKGGNDLIEITCKNTPNYQLCVSTLQSDPRSLDTDVYGLGLVVVDAVKDKASATLDHINKLKGSNIPDFIFPLMKCYMLYNAIMVGDIPEAIEGLKKGVPKFAEFGMVDTALEVQICENSFKQSNSPLTSMNKDVYDLSLVARSIIRTLL